MNDSPPRSPPGTGIVGVGLLVLRSDARLDTVDVLAGLTAAASIATDLVPTKCWSRPVTLAALNTRQLLGLSKPPLA